MEEEQIMKTKSESPPPGVPKSLSDSAGFLLNRAARIIREMNTAALAPLGLSVRELGLLRIIASDGPLSQQVLGEKHNTDRTTIVELIDLLEKRELVQRIVNTKDRRAYLIYLTPKGKRVLAKALKLTQKQQEKFLAALNESEWLTLKQMLVRLISHNSETQNAG
jgi:DNA-binding MarR family transcriptional regulator